MPLLAEAVAFPRGCAPPDRMVRGEAAVAIEADEVRPKGWRCTPCATWKSDGKLVVSEPERVLQPQLVVSSRGHRNGVGLQSAAGSVEDMAWASEVEADEVGENRIAPPPPSPHRLFYGVSGVSGISGASGVSGGIWEVAAQHLTRSVQDVGRPFQDVGRPFLESPLSEEAQELASLREEVARLKEERARLHEEILEAAEVKQEYHQQAVGRISSADGPATEMYKARRELKQNGYISNHAQETLKAMAANVPSGSSMGSTFSAAIRIPASASPTQPVGDPTPSPINDCDTRAMGGLQDGMQHANLSADAIQSPPQPRDENECCSNDGDEDQEHPAALPSSKALASAAGVAGADGRLPWLGRRISGITSNISGSSRSTATSTNASTLPVPGVAGARGLRKPVSGSSSSSPSRRIRAPWQPPSDSSSQPGTRGLRYSLSPKKWGGVGELPPTPSTSSSASALPSPSLEKQKWVSCYPCGLVRCGSAKGTLSGVSEPDSADGSHQQRSAERSLVAVIAPEIMYPTYVGTMRIFDDYEFLGDISSGCFGRVMMVRHRQSGYLRACKAVAVRNTAERELVDTEIHLLKSLNHPNILKMHETYLTESEEGDQRRKIYLITELCEGGDLLFRIAYHYHQLEQPMQEGHVAYMLRQVLSASRYCHDRGVIHRDIKPANILFVDRSRYSPLKVIDLGLANFTEKLRQTAKEVEVPRGGARGRLARMLPAVGGRHLINPIIRKQMMQRAGTPHYMAPEMIVGGCYDQKADMFSVGIVLCEMLAGWHPFFTPEVDTTESVHARIMAPQPVEFPERQFADISAEARDLCRRLLEKTPQKRFSAGQALAHTWFDEKPSPFGNAEALTPSILEGLMQFQAENKLKRAGFQILARELSEMQVQELRGAFMALDVQGDGLLSPEELAEGLRQVGLPAMEDAELRRMVDALDASGSQRVGYKEFLSALAGRRVRFDRHQLWECFKKFDPNGTGRIVYQDVLTVFGDHQGRPAITESEWQEIVDPDAMQRKSGGIDSHNQQVKCELTFEQFVAIMGTNPN